MEATSLQITPLDFFFLNVSISLVIFFIFYTILLKKITWERYFYFWWKEQ
jgi:hypothetical protein